MDMNYHLHARTGLCPLIFLHNILLFFYYWWDGTKSPGTTATSGLLYKPRMIDADDCGAIGGMKIGRGNQSTRRKPAPAPLCPPQIPHDQTLGSNPGRRGGKPATNRLSYGAAYEHMLLNAAAQIEETAAEFPQFALLRSVTCLTQADNDSRKLRLPFSLVCPRRYRL
jgi:hypothetical protein